MSERKEKNDETLSPFYASKVKHAKEKNTYYVNADYLTRPWNVYGRDTGSKLSAAALKM